MAIKKAKATDGEQRYKDRIGYAGELSDISKPVCRAFNLGEFVSNEIVKVGYEDFNMIIETSRGRSFVKIFSRFRDAEPSTHGTCERYVEIMRRASESGANVPRLFRSEQGYLHSLDANGVALKLCVMQFIEGNSLYALGGNPSSDEVRSIAGQASLIDNIYLKPSPVYDAWAGVNFANEFMRKSKYLNPDDLALVKPLLKAFRGVDLSGLPHSFVHGDIIKTNVIRDKTGKLWVVDFAVSNYYPRIVELAVLACNILFDGSSRAASESNLRLAVKEYEKRVKLTKEEHGLLPLFVNVAHAMHVLCANYEKAVNGNATEENEYWLEQGRSGLAGTQ